MNLTEDNLSPKSTLRGFKIGYNDASNCYFVNVIISLKIILGRTEPKVASDTAGFWIRLSYS